MSNPPPAAIKFILNGRRYDLTREVVDAQLAGVPPDRIRKHAVRINGIWFPVIQAFEIATGIPRSEFISHAARRHLAGLGYEVHGEIDSRTTPGIGPSPVGAIRAGAAPRLGREELSEEWHTEANVQAVVVTNLASRGWRILSVANTATKEHGIDVIAVLGGQTTGVEVKGFPSRNYADPSRVGETKRTRPSTQAGHWYSQAILAAMRLRGKKPHWRSVIALPDFPRYRDLYAETSGSLSAAEIEVWWVASDGSMNLDHV